MKNREILVIEHAEISSLANEISLVWKHYPSPIPTHRPYFFSLNNVRSGRKQQCRADSNKRSCFDLVLFWFSRSYSRTLNWTYFWLITSSSRHLNLTIFDWFGQATLRFTAKCPKRTILIVVPHPYFDFDWNFVFQILVTARLVCSLRRIIVSSKNRLLCLLGWFVNSSSVRCTQSVWMLAALAVVYDNWLSASFAADRLTHIGLLCGGVCWYSQLREIDAVNASYLRMLY